MDFAQCTPQISPAKVHAIPETFADKTRRYHCSRCISDIGDVFALAHLVDGGPDLKVSARDEAVRLSRRRTEGLPVAHNSLSRNFPMPFGGGLPSERPQKKSKGFFRSLSGSFSSRRKIPSGWLSQEDFMQTDDEDFYAQKGCAARSDEDEFWSSSDTPASLDDLTENEPGEESGAVCQTPIGVGEGQKGADGNAAVADSRWKTVCACEGVEGEIDKNSGAVLGAEAVDAGVQAGCEHREAAALTDCSDPPSPLKDFNPTVADAPSGRTANWNLRAGIYKALNRWAHVGNYTIA